MTREQLAQFLSQDNSKVPSSPLDVLDERELEVFSILSQGYSASQIESQFGIGADELKAIQKSLRNKLKLKDDVQLIRYAAKHQPG